MDKELKEKEADKQPDEQEDAEKETTIKRYRRTSSARGNNPIPRWSGRHNE